MASRALGHGRTDSIGFNQGLLELASGFEVTDYFHQLMRDTFLASGRVSFHPMSELVGEPGSGAYAIRSLLSGATQTVEVRKRLVDATGPALENLLRLTAGPATDGSVATAGAAA